MRLTHRHRRRSHSPLARAAAVTAAALVSVGLAAGARAEVILSNFELPRGTNTTGINQLFHKAVGITISGSTSYEFTSLEAPIRNLTTTAFTATGTIRADSGGNPGAILASLSSVVLPGSGPTSTFVDYAFTGSFTLLAGQSYWFVLESDRPVSGNEVAWGSPASNAAPTPAAGITFLGYRQGAVAGGTTTWTNSTLSNSVRINAAVVPEPGTLALLPLGALALAGGHAGAALRRRRSRSAV